MAVEILVQRVDKINPSSDKSNAQLFKRGDVITVHDVGWPWSYNEIENGDRVIMKIDDMSMGDILPFLRPEVAISDPLAQPLLKVRGVKIDLDGMTGQISLPQKANDKFPWDIIFDHTAAHVLDNMIVKPAAPVEVITP